MSELPQIIHGLSFQTYVEEIDALNFSRLKSALDSALHLWTAINDPEEEEQSLDCALGEIVHGWTLERRIVPHVIKPEGMSFATREGKAWRGEQKAAGLIILDEKADLRQIRMCKSLEKDEDACRYLDVCESKEVSITAVYRSVKLKSRLDAAKLQGRCAIADLKKCRCAKPRAWGNTVAERHYLLQAAVYSVVAGIALDLGTAPAFAWIVIEDSAAAPVMVYRPDADQLALGKRLLDKCIDTYLRGMETGLWPSYGVGEQTFVLPKYYEMEAAAA